VSASPTAARLCDGFRGEVITPGDPGYDAARTVWNGMIDKHPAYIARCTGSADVADAIRFARAHDLVVAVRGGAHNVAGFAACDGGIVIDLSPMKGIRVDPVARTVRAQAGVTWGELDRETQSFGLATPGGLISSTGIAGLTLGGGFGWLSRAFGLACDNLISADLVDAEGRALTASRSHNAELFWGLRGGGGNFGIVTSFEFQLHPVGPIVFGGAVFHRAGDARALLRAYRDFTAGAPDQITSAAILLSGPPAPFLPPDVHGAPLVAFAALYAGSVDAAPAALAPLRGIGTPVCDLFGELPYTALQSMFDATAPPGLQNYWKTESLSQLSDAAIDALLAPFAAMPSPLSHIDVHHLGGAIARAGDDAGACGLRDAPFVVNVVGMWPDPAESPQQISWVRDGWAGLRPLADAGVYVNFLGEEGADRVAAAYGPEKYARLAALKKAYDPANVFRLNQNVTPMS
jgi:FAD/FMN-containing dehydrogenase